METVKSFPERLADSVPVLHVDDKADALFTRELSKDGSAKENAEIEVGVQTARLNVEKANRKAKRRLDALLRETPKTRKQYRKLSKLADATGTVVLSREEFVAHCRERKARLDELTKQSRNQGSHTEAERLQRAALAMQLRELFVPLWLVTMEGESYYVSPNVVSDWRTERIPFVVKAKQRLSRIGRIASVRKVDVDASVVEQSADARGNRHAMGLAQTAWRIAHCEGNVDAELAAHHWLFHGTLKPCNDPACLQKQHSPCRYRRMQAAELTHLAFVYLEAELTEQRSNNNGSRRAHKMRAPTTDELSLAFNGWR